MNDYARMEPEATLLIASFGRCSSQVTEAGSEEMSSEGVDTDIIYYYCCWEDICGNKGQISLLRGWLVCLMDLMACTQMRQVGYGGMPVTLYQLEEWQTAIQVADIVRQYLPA